MSLSIFPATPSDTGRLPWALHHTSSSPGWTVPTFPAWLHRRDAPVLLQTSGASFGLGPTGSCPYYVRNTRTLCNIPGGGHPNLKAQFLFFCRCSGFNSQYHQQSYLRDLPKIRQFTSATRCSACIRKQHRVYQHQLDSVTISQGQEAKWPLCLAAQRLWLRQHRIAENLDQIWQRKGSFICGYILSSVCGWNSH